MNATDLIREAKSRLVELEAEAATLRLMIASAEGISPFTPPVTLPAIPPLYVPGAGTPLYVGDPVCPSSPVTSTGNALPYYDIYLYIDGAPPADDAMTNLRS
jgi:hypothetical protein